MDHPVQFRLSRSGTWWNGRARNLSHSGMLFSCQVCLEIGTVMVQASPGSVAIEGDHSRHDLNDPKLALWRVADPLPTLLRQNR